MIVKTKLTLPNLFFIGIVLIRMLELYGAELEKGANVRKLLPQSSWTGSDLQIVTPQALHLELRFGSFENGTESVAHEGLGHAISTLLFSSRSRQFKSTRLGFSIAHWEDEDSGYVCVRLAHNQ